MQILNIKDQKKKIIRNLKEQMCNKILILPKDDENFECDHFSLGWTLSLQVMCLWSASREPPSRLLR